MTQPAKSKFLSEAETFPLATLVGILITFATGVGAAPILIDINRTGQGNTATAAEFVAAGVTEDLTGASVVGINVPSTTGNAFSGGGLTFSFSSPFTASYDVGLLGSDSFRSNNSLLDSYVYLNAGGPGPGPANVTVSGLSAKLEPNTSYRLYLFGSAGRNANQNSEFTFPLTGVTQTTHVPGTLSDAVVASSFTTGSIVSNTLTFKWSRVGTNTYAAFNGLAITTISPLQLWRQANFGTPYATGNAADNADPEKDGLENLVEFAFGLKPNVPDAAALPQWVLADEDYSLAFTRPANVSGVTYVAEYSPSLAPGSWTAATNFGTAQNYNFLVLASTQRLYLRVRVTMP